MKNDAGENGIEFDDEEQDNDSVLDIPKEERKLLTQAYDKSVSDIVRMIADGEIRLNPDYQREYIWDNKKASLLIESLLLNVPIPVIYVSQEEDDTWNVIDGLQRLNSLKRFFDRDFKISGLEVLHELNKEDVKTIPVKALRVIKNGLLRVVVISHDSNPEIKYDIFMRLNRGSIKLSEQELRNCLYRGPLNNLIKEMRSNHLLLKIMNLKSPHKRMVDAELILRFLALDSAWDRQEMKLQGFKNKFKPFLNDFMFRNQNAEEIDINKLRTKFEKTIENVYKVFGANAFRRIDANGKFEKNINRALMDCIMISFTGVDYSIIASKSQQILESLTQLLNNEKSEFLNAVTISTGDRPQVQKRLEIWQRTFQTTINA